MLSGGKVLPNQVRADSNSHVSIQSYKLVLSYENLLRMPDTAVPSPLTMLWY
jgi:hypothetical protein